LEVQDELKLLAQSDAPASSKVFEDFSKQELAEADKKVDELKDTIAKQQQS
jgi:hypothetical protein